LSQLKSFATIVRTAVKRRKSVTQVVVIKERSWPKPAARFELTGQISQSSSFFEFRSTRRPKTHGNFLEKATLTAIKETRPSSYTVLLKAICWSRVSGC